MSRTSWEDLRAQYHGNFIVQRRLQQHADLAALNASSINTLRILTLRLDEPWVVASAIRIGRAGSHVDNKTAGRAVICGILPDGRLNSWATDPKENRVLVHPDAGYSFGGQEVPGIRAAWDFVLGLHRRLLYFDLVAWDVTIGPDCQPRLVEVNLRAPEINFHQVEHRAAIRRPHGGSPPLRAQPQTPCVVQLEQPTLADDLPCESSGTFANARRTHSQCSVWGAGALYAASADAPGSARTSISWYSSIMQARM